jgi:hypothetical protein
MRTTIFYVFEPTVLLCELANAAGQDFVAQRSVWLVPEHDRVGVQYSKAEVSCAHWAQFLANLVGEEEAPPALAELLQKCLSLGFEKCWTALEAKIGGDVKDLMDEAQAAKSFLNERGVALSLD